MSTIKIADKPTLDTINTNVNSVVNKLPSSNIADKSTLDTINSNVTYIKNNMPSGSGGGGEYNGYKYWSVLSVNLSRSVPYSSSVGSTRSLYLGLKIIPNSPVLLCFSETPKMQTESGMYNAQFTINDIYFNTNFGNTTTSPVFPINQIILTPNTTTKIMGSNSTNNSSVTIAGTISTKVLIFYSTAPTLQYCNTGGKSSTTSESYSNISFSLGQSTIYIS